MREIQLTQGMVALVDDADFDWLNQWKWYAARWEHLFYAVRDVRISGGNKQHIRMHRVIAGEAFPEVDHHNGNGLDNQRHNLRRASSNQNKWNTRRRKDNTSGFKGVHFDGRNWRARIKLNGKSRNLGRFATPEKAHLAYCDAATALFGEFARTA